MLKNKVFGDANGERIEVRNLLTVTQHQNYKKLTGKMASTSKGDNEYDTEKLIGVMIDISKFLIASCGVQIVTYAGEELKFDGTIIKTENNLSKIYNSTMIDEAVEWILQENNLRPKKEEKEEEIPGN
ncbi:MAG: hypothetical protein ACRCUS_01375 [Anaerovoracaceae bacterium]